MSTLSSTFVSGNIKQCNHHQLLVLLFISCVLLSAYFTSPANGITIGSRNNTMCNEHEREALLKFKHGIRVDSCGLLSTWGNHPNCCEWDCVRCNNNTGRVIGLNLRGSGDDGRCLEGELGSSVAELKHLRHLDLSFNIPHLQSLGASAYAGNPGLCGLPLPNCPWDQPRGNNPTKGDDVNHNQDKNDSDDLFTVGLCVSVILGFIIGFWGVCGTLVLKRS